VGDGLSHSEKAYKLRGLIPWLTRSEVMPGQLKTQHFNDIYITTLLRVQQADAVLQTIAASFYRAATSPTTNDSNPGSSRQFYEVALDEWERWAADGAPFAPPGIAAVLAAFVVQQYSTFETFAGDVWERAVNVHPRLLAEMKGRPWSKSPRQSDTGSPEAKTLRFEVLRENDYDVRLKMGSVLRRAGHARFGTLAGIRDAYAKAFSKRGNAIEAALSEKAFDAVAALRNVIVHRGGVADANYVAAVRGIPLAPSAADGESIWLDGEMISTLLLAGLPRTRDLLVAVDDWIS
jgi:hypothetical protein